MGDVVNALAQLGTERYAQRHLPFFLYKRCGLCSHLRAYTPLDVHQEPDISYVESSAK